MDPSTTLTLAQMHLDDLRRAVADARLAAGARLSGPRALDTARRPRAGTLLGAVRTRLRALTADRMATPSR